MRAAVYVDKHTIELRDTHTPTLGVGDVLLRVSACGVCGTDVRKVLNDLVKSPTVLGHEVAGEVVDVGTDVRKFKVGDRVVVAHHTPCYICHYCRHKNFSMCRKFKTSNLDPGGFAEFLRIPAEHVDLTAYKIPHGMSDEVAIFMEPLACVLRNFKRAHLLAGDTVMVVGLGSMGILTGQVAKALDCSVVATDLREDRIAIGKNLGFEISALASSPTLIQETLDLTQGRRADLVVLTAGNASTYSSVTQYVRDGGAINIFAGLGPAAQVSYNVEELYSRELTVYSSYSPSPTELGEALEYLRTEKVRVDVLGSNWYPLNGVKDAIDAVSSQKILKAIISPKEGHV